MNDPITTFAGRTKPLPHKAYGSIGHLPNSRMGPADHHVPEGQAKIATERTRSRHDRVIVTEKLDGSCTAIARINGALVALGRAGWLAQSSPYEQHQLFAAWVRANEGRFEFMGEGERYVGEWLAQAHGTRYQLEGRQPWVMFDVMVQTKRKPWDVVRERARFAGLSTPHVIMDGPPTSVEQALDILGPTGAYGALDPVEGAVWRIERRGEFDFMAKYVRPDKVDGAYLPEVSGQSAIWNWRPS